MSEPTQKSWRLKPTRWIALVLVLAASACASPGGAPPTSLIASASAPVTTTTKPSVSTTTAAVSTTTGAPAVTKTPGIEYADGRQLDVYAPTELAGWPVVVVVHGLGQTRGGFSQLAEAIASEGAVVFNISTVFAVPPLDGIEDIACAIRFARALAEYYGGDNSSITLLGNSSGAAKGSIVAMNGDGYQGNCTVTDGSALPNALVGYEGPFDYATHLYGTFDVPGLQEADPAMWEAVNPYSHIGGNGDLIVRLIHGNDNDAEWYDVLPEVSAEFQQALLNAGYDVELTYLEGEAHGSLRPGTEAFDVAVQQVMAVAGG